MVSKAYMLDKPSGPSRPKLFLDQRIVPLLIDAAGAVEALLERVAVRARRHPLSALGTGLGAGAGLGTLAALLLPSRRS